MTYLEKLPRRTLPRPRLPILIIVIPHELCIRRGRRAQRRTHDGIDLLHQRFLLGTHGGQYLCLGEVRGRAEGGDEATEDEGVLAEFGREEAVEW